MKKELGRTHIEREPLLLFFLVTLRLVVVAVLVDDDPTDASVVLEPLASAILCFPLGRDIDPKVVLGVRIPAPESPSRAFASILARLVLGRLPHDGILHPGPPIEFLERLAHRAEDADRLALVEQAQVALEVLVHVWERVRGSGRFGCGE